MKTKIFIILCSVVILGSARAHAEKIVIDFEILGAGGDDGPTNIGSIYSEDGFTLTTNEFFVYKKILDTANIVMSVGPPIITRDNGELFDLLSFDYCAVHELTLTVTGLKDDGTAISKVFIFEGYTPLNTYKFDSFTDLKSVSWNMGGYNYFDNITIIPEPATLMFFILGGVIIRRTKL